MVAATFLIKQPFCPLSSLTWLLRPLPLLRERPPTTSATRAALRLRSLALLIAYMDSKSQTVITIDPTSDSGKAKKKRGGGAVQIFKVALFMLRRRSKKSKASVDMGSDKGLWRRLLGSMRPLHIQGNDSAPANMSSSPTPKPKEDFEELPMPLPSPSPSASASSSSFSPASRSSSFCTSQYASATNLQELDDRSDDDDEDEDEDAIRDDNGGDEMIDAKAEEFIAQFYEQMRRQRHNIY